MNGNVAKAAVGVATATLGLGLAAPATASTSTTYHGYYDGVTTFEPDGAGAGACVPDTMPVTGTWNVRVSDDAHTATMSTNLFYDGRHHLAYGGGFAVESVGDHAFTITAETASPEGTPITITLTLSPDGELVYTVAPYPLYGQNCASLTLTGHEGRPAG